MTIEPLPNPFEEADSKRDLLDHYIERTQKLEEQVKLLMSVVTMLARAEEYRIKKHVDKIES